MENIIILILGVIVALKWTFNTFKCAKSVKQGNVTISDKQIFTRIISLF